MRRSKSTNILLFQIAADVGSPLPVSFVHGFLPMCVRYSLIWYTLISGLTDTMHKRSGSGCYVCSASIHAYQDRRYDRQRIHALFKRGNTLGLPCLLMNGGIYAGSNLNKAKQAECLDRVPNSIWIENDNLINQPLYLFDTAVTLLFVPNGFGSLYII